MPQTRGAVARPARRTLLVAMLCAVLVLALLPLGHHPTTADATVRQPFASVFSSDENGAITIVGNSQMSCQTSKAGCAAARAGSGADAINNSWDMEFLDVDSSAATTNSTSADLAMPAGSTVLYARLVWGGRLSAGDDGVAGTGTYSKVSLRAPGDAGYTTVTGTTVIQPTAIAVAPYQASLDVTSQVAAAGNGTYAVGNIVAGTGLDRYAGWSLVVAYRNPNLPLRNLVVYEGFADVTDGSNSSVNVSVSGFLTPATGAVNATVGFLAWEGDLPTDGDYLKFNNTILSDSERPSDNTFDSKITDYGAKVTTRNANYPNTFGVDMGRVSANGLLKNKATSTTVTVATSGDYIYLGLLTTEIDLYAPSFVGVSKTVSNLAGNSPARAGDTLEYTLSFTNSGADYADAVVLRDTLPAGITYLPGSIKVATGANASTTPKTDATGDDVAEYVAASRLVRVRLGTGATSAAGGTVAANAASSVTFRATVDRSASGATIDNGSFLDYRARTLARNYTFVTNTVTTTVAPLADLAITKTSTPASQTAGSSVTYALTVTNAGPNAATGVIATDTLPAGLTFVSANPPSGVTCSRTGQVVSCAVGTLANGASVTIPVVASLAATAAAGSVLDVARVSADTADDNATDNTATAATTVTRSADLRVAKTGSGSVVAGGQATYTVTVSNDGPSTATAASLTDTLPVGMTFVSATPSSGTCSNASNTVSCTLGDLAPSAARTVTVVGKIAAAYLDNAIVNTASASSTTPDANAANNSDSATTTVTRKADITLAKTVTPANPSAGTEVTYTLTVNNAGPSDAAQVTLTDPAPAGMTFTSASPTQGSCNLESNPLSCALGTVPAGGTAKVTLTGAIAAGRNPGTLTNTAKATTTTAQTSTSDDTASVSSTVVGRADVSLVKVGSPNPVSLGQQLTYTLTANNLGPSQARGVVVTDTLPAQVTLVSAKGCTVSGRTVSCPVGAIEVGDATTATIVVQTPDGLPEGEDLVNTATSSSTSTDPNTANNTATFTSGDESFADLSLTKSTSPEAIVPGQQVTYTLTGSDAGPAQAQGVTITDTLPPGLSFVSATPEGACSEDAGTVTCRTTSLGGEQTFTVQITAAVDPDLTDRRSTNVATIAAARPADPTTSNNTASSTVDVAPIADVSVILSPDRDDFRAGEAASYVLSVTNGGPSSAYGAVATAQFPAGFVPAPNTGGPNCTVQDRTVSCTVPGSLGPDQTVSFPLQALVGSSLPQGSVTTTAQVGATTTDPNGENNSALAPIYITNQADVVAGKSVSPDPIVAGGPVTYTLTATNRGPSDAAGVRLSDRLPPGLTNIATSPSAGSCTVEDQTVNCTVDRVAPNGVLTVLVTADVGAGLTGTITNSASVGSETESPPDTTDNDTVTITTNVGQSADLRLTKTAAPDPVQAGQTVAYTLTAYNAGPSDAAAVTLTDALPAGVTFSSVQAPEGTSCGVKGATVNCPLGTVRVGASQTITVLALVGPDLADGTKLANTASLSSTTGTQNEAGRTAKVTSTVSTGANLSIAKTANTASPLSGGTEEYVLTAVNNGPSIARNVVITDELPDGETFRSVINPAGTCTRSGSTVTCPVGDLKPGQVAVVQLSVQFDPTSTGGPISNVAKVASNTVDADSSDNRIQFDQRVSAQNDLSLTKKRTSGAVVAGQPVTYALTVTNNGPSQARNVKITDPVQDPLGYLSASASADGSCAYDAATQTPDDDDQVACSWPVLDVGASRTATLTFSTPGSVAAGSQLRNTATAASDAPDPTAATATVTDEVTARSDLHVTKSLLSGVPVAGGEVRWQILVTNPGPSLAQGVTVRDLAPKGVSFTRAVTGQGSCTAAPGAIDCSLGTVGTDPVTVTVVAQLAADYTGASLTNTATVASDTVDLNPDDNTASVTTSATTTADLSVTNTASPTQGTAGQDITWTVVVTNLGPSKASNLTVTNPLPAGVTLRSVVLAGASCTSGSTAICQLASLAPGASATMTVVGRLASSYALATVADRASVSASTADPNPLNNSARATSNVVASSDVSVTVAGPSSITAGSVETWTLTARNGGPSDAPTTKVTFQLPSWVVDLAGTFKGGSCTVTGSLLTCPVGTLGAGVDTVVTVTGRVPADQPVDTLATSAAVSSTATDPDPSNNTARFSSAVTRSADVTLTKAATTRSFTPGNLVSWTITASNAGPSTAESVTITDAIPAGVANPSATLGGVDCPINDGVVTCSVAVLAPGIPAIVVINGTLDAALTAKSLVNTARLAAGTADPDGDDNTSTATTDVVPSADVSVGKAITTGTPVAGAPISFSLQVSSSGPSVARHVVVRDTMPSQVTIGAVRSPVGSCTVNQQDIACDLGDLLPGADLTIVIDGTVNQAFATTLDNRASLTSDTADPDSTNSETGVTGSVDEAADLAVTMTGPARASGGEVVEWSMTVTNVGPSDARDVVLADLLPEGVSFLSATADNGGICSEVVSCDLGRLGPAQTVKVVVRARLSTAYVRPTLVDNVILTAASADPNTLNNTATVRTEVATSADLQTVLTLDPTALTAGTDARYTLVVRNAGPSTSTAVTATFELPAGMTFRDGGPSSADADCQLIGRTVGCFAALLDPDQTLTIDIPVRLAASYTEASVTATGSASSATPDPDRSNDSDTLSTDVETQADLTLTKSAPATVTAGEPISWQLALGNDGPSDAQSVVITDSLPAGVGAVVATPSQGSCTQNGRVLTCQLGTVADGGVVSVGIETDGNLDPNYAPGDLTNSATATSPTPDDPSDTQTDPSAGRTSTATTTVAAAADVEVYKVPTSLSAVAGGAIGWTVTVINRGPSTAHGVTLSDPAPAGLDGFAIDPPTGVSCTAAGVCAIGDLAPGEENALVFSVTAEVPADSGRATISNEAGAIDTTDDPDPGDNSARSTVPITTASNLSIVKRLTSTAVVPGRRVTWTLTVSNAGPSTAHQVAVTDTLADALSGVDVDAPDGVDCSTAVSCTLDELPADTSVTITISAVLSASYAGADLPNRASVTSDQADPDTADNVSTVTSPVGASADLKLSKTGPVGPVTRGSTISWTLALTNDGPSTARGVTVRDVVPSGVTDVAVSATEGGALTCSVEENAVSCAAAALASGPTPLTIKVSGVLSAGFAGSTLTNTATVESADTTDPDLTSNTATATTAVNGTADLVITQSVVPNPIVAGSSATFTILVTNAGPSTAVGAQVVDTLAPGLSLTAATSTAGSCAGVGQVVTCNLGDLPPIVSPLRLQLAAVAPQPEPVRIQLTVAVAGDFDPAGFVNVATVQANTSDPKLANNTSRIAGDTVTRADLHLTKTADVTSVAPGGTVNWTLTASNDGPATARTVVVVDRLPDGVSVSSVTTDAGACTPTTGVLSCAIGDLASGDSAVIVITAELGADASADLVNSATVQSSTTDPDDGDNIAQRRTAIATVADLGITKVLDTNPVVAGQPVTWTLTVDNQGPGTASAVVVTDVLPADVGFTSATPGCTAAGQTVTCLVPDLAAEQSAQLSVTGLLSASASGTLENTASVTSAALDPQGVNDAATTSAPISRIADLAVTKRVDLAEVAVGHDFVYTITVSNQGPSDASGATVTDVWPAGLDLIGQQASQGTYSPTTHQWSVGTVPNGGSASLTLTAAATSVGTVTNAVRLSSGDFTDPSDVNGQDAVSIVIASTSTPDQPRPPAHRPPIAALPNTGGPDLWLGFAGVVLLAGSGTLLARRPRRRRPGPRRAGG